MLKQKITTLTLQFKFNPQAERERERERERPLAPKPYLRSRVARFGSNPRAQKNRVLGPKCYNIIGVWALKPYYLGPWTLRGNYLRGNYQGLLAGG